MKKRVSFFCLVLCFSLLVSSAFSASFKFADERFQGEFTTENLDRIIQEYELFDGWYWTTEPWVRQTFHGLQDSPGWTYTAVKIYGRRGYVRGMYGCRWMSNQVYADNPDGYGQGECFAFAQFIGYLLTGEYNPHRNWDFFYSLESSGGLRVGDILRTEFTSKGKTYQHSAIVYSVSEDEVLFMQVSGSLYNLISVGTGYLYGNHNSPTTLEELEKIPSYKVCRSPLNAAVPEEPEEP